MNTYSPGLRKQRACVPCPSGFSTMGKVGQSRVDACGEWGGCCATGYHTAHVVSETAQRHLPFSTVILACFLARVAPDLAQLFFTVTLTKRSSMLM
jgi:hypothetical protein